MSFATSFLSPPFSFYMQMRVYSNHESPRATAGGIFIIKDKEVGSIAEFLVFFSPIPKKGTYVKEKIAMLAIVHHIFFVNGA